MPEQPERVAANGEPGELYLFADGSWAIWEGAGAGKQRVYIHSRTIIRTLSGELVATYEIEDRLGGRGTRWQAGNGELSREE